MKKQTKLLVAVPVAVAAVAGLTTATACGEKSEKTEGTYYVYQQDQSTQGTLSLDQKRNYTLNVGGKEYTGTYTLKEGQFTFKSKDKKDENVIVGTLNDETKTVSITVNGTQYLFYFDASATVTFDANNGSTASNTEVTVKNGQTVITTPVNPTATGKLFEGWYADANFTTPFGFGTTIINGNTTVYAKWRTLVGTQNEYTISFNAGEGASEHAAKQTIEGYLDSVPTPTKSGYTFMGWYYSDTDNAEQLTGKYNKDTTFDSNQSLYAVWQSNTASTTLNAPMVSVGAEKITWDAIKNAQGYVVTVKDAEGETVKTETVNIPSANFNFAEQEAGVYSVEVYAKGQTDSLNSPVTTRYYTNKGLARVSLFDVENNVLTFNKVEGATSYTLTVTYAKGEGTETATIELQDKNTFDFATLGMPANGINFTVEAKAEGKYTSVSKQFNVKQMLTAVTDLAVNDATKTLTWTAVENATEYVVNINDGTNTYKKVVTECSLSLAEYAGQINITVYPRAAAYYSPAAATTSWTNTGLAMPQGIALNGNTLTWTAVEGATGYKVMVDGTEYDAAEATFDMATATWDKENDCVVKVKALGEGDKESAYSVEFTIAKPNSAVTGLAYANGYLTWNAVSGATTYKVSINGTVTESTGNSYALEIAEAGEVTIKVAAGNGPYSDELKVTFYALTFNADGGVNLATRYLAEGDYIYDALTEKTGYTFDGWYNGELLFADDIFRGNADLALKAKWKANEYTITYDLDDDENVASVNNATVTVVYNNNNYFLDVPTRTDGVQFVGWYTEVAGQGVQITDNTGKGLASWTYARDTKLYAYWALTVDYRLSSDGQVYYARAGAGISNTDTVEILAKYRGKLVSDIPNEAFLNCSTIKQINIPNSIETVGNSAFSGCTMLEKIVVYNVEGTHEVFYESSADGQFLIWVNKINGEKEIKVTVPNLKGDIVLPEGITIVKGFKSKTAITSVVIPSTVRTIEKEAFASCTGLKSVTFAPTPEDQDEVPLTIGEKAFSSCTNAEFTTITLPKRLVSIVSPDTRVVTISGQNPQKLDADFVSAFSGCTKLEEINVEKGNTTYASNDGILYSADFSTLWLCPRAKTFGDEGELVINIVGTKPVRHIAPEAFYYNANIKKLTIGINVQDIGHYAFYYADGITSLTFKGDDLAGKEGFKIAPYAFYRLADLEELTFEEGCGVSEIGYYAFYYMGYNKEGCLDLVLPDTLTKLEYYSFYYAKALKSVTFTSKAPDVNSSAFYGCSALTTCYLNEDVEKFAFAGAFAGLTTQTVAYVIADGNHYHKTTEDGIIYGIDAEGVEKVLEYFPATGITNYVLPETVEEIMDRIFDHNTEITSISFSKNVTKIGAHAFYYASNLTAVTFEEGGTQPLEIGEYAFSYSGITSIRLPDRTVAGYEEGTNKQLMGTYVFYYCKQLQTVSLPATMGEIPAYTFYYCTALETIDVRAVDGQDAKMKTIEKYAFYHTDVLTQLNLPDTVETIYEYAFAYGKFTTFTMPASVRFVASYAFSYCQSLEEVYFGAKLEDLAYPQSSATGTTAKPEIYSTFASCKALKKIVIDPENKFYSNDANGFLYGAGQARLLFAPPATTGNVTADMFPETLREIAPYAFYYSLINKLELPNTLTYVEKYAFYYAEMKEVTFQDGGKYNLDIGVNFLGKQTVDGTEVDATATTFYVFYYCSKLEKIYFPNNIHILSNSAIYNCAALEEVEFGSSQTGEDAFTPDFYFGNSSPTSYSYVFYTTAKLRRVLNIPNRTRQIANKLFYSGGVVEEITFEEGGDMTSTMIIGTYAQNSTSYTYGAFASLTALRRIKLPARVTEMRAGTFYGCTKLQSVTFEEGSNLTFIGYYNFSSTALLEYEFGDKLVEVSAANKIFYNLTTLRKLVYGKKMTAIAPALEGITDISNIEIDISKTDMVRDENGVIYATAEKKAIAYYPVYVTTEELDLSASEVETIAAGAFKGNPNLKKVIMPNKLMQIPDNCFDGCTALEEVVFGASSEMSMIGNNAFNKCSALTSVTFGTATDITQLGNYAFAGCTELVELKMPRFVGDTIGMYAFDGCEKLESLDLGNLAGLKKIDSYAFRHTDSLKSFDLSNATQLAIIGYYGFTYSGIESIHIPDSCTHIGNYAFRYCANLKTITGLKNVVGGAGTSTTATAAPTTTVPTYVFGDCTKLTSFTCPDNWTKIPFGSSMFYGCTSLESFDFNNVTDGSSAVNLLQNCTALTTVKMGKLQKLSNYMFYNCTALTGLDLKNVTTLGQYCFRGTTFITSIGDTDDYDLNLSNTALGAAGLNVQYAFAYMDSLKKVKLPAKFTAYGANLFYYCGGLEEVEFDAAIASTVKISNYMFAYCSSLRKVVLPDKMTDIAGQYAFRDTKKLEEINLDKLTKISGTYAFYGCGLKEVDLPLVTSIANYTFYYTEAEKISLPKCTSVGTYAFGYAVDLKEVNIPLATSIGNYAFQYGKYGKVNLDKVTKLGSYMFYYATGVEEVNAPLATDTNTYTFAYFKGKTMPILNMPKLTTIGNYAFQYSYLEEFDFPNVTTIGTNAFYYSAAKTIKLPKVKNIPASAFRGYTTESTTYPMAALTHIEIPSATDIGNYAFAGQMFLEEVNLPDTVKTFGNYVFQDCYALKEAKLPGFLTEVPTYTFSNCRALTKVTLSDKITKIGTYAFRGCTSLEEVEMSDNITEIGNYAFNGCSALTSVTLPSKLATAGTYLFQNCTSLEEVTIPDGVKALGNYMFDGCESLTAVELPASIETFGDYMFRNCTSLTDLTISEGILSLAKYAFQGCTALEEVDLPMSLTTVNNGLFDTCTSLVRVTGAEGVQTVEDFAFNGCTALEEYAYSDLIESFGKAAFQTCSSLKSIQIPSTMKEIGSWAFSGCASVTTLTLPEGVETLGERAFQSCAGIKKIVIPTTMTEIGYAAFLGCTGVTELVLPATLKVIGDAAFANFESLTVIDMSMATELEYVGANAFQNATSCTEVRFSEACSNYGTGAFRGLGCTTVTLPAAVKEVSAYMFYGAENLASITAPGATIWGDFCLAGTALTEFTLNGKSIYGINPFAGSKIAEFKNDTTNPASLQILEGNVYSADGETLLYYACGKTGDFKMPDAVTSLEEAALAGATFGTLDMNKVSVYKSGMFSEVKFDNLLLGSVVTKLDPDAFSNLEVEELIFPGSFANAFAELYTKGTEAKMFEGTTAKKLTFVNDDNGTWTALPEYVFYGMPNLEELSLPETLTTLGAYAFSYSGNAEIAMTLPATLTNLGDHTFSYAEYKQINLINDETHKWRALPAYFYDHMSNLEDVVLPDTLTTLGAYCFNYAGNAEKSLVLPASITTVGDHLFAYSTFKKVTLSHDVTVVGTNNATYGEASSYMFYYSNIDEVELAEGCTKTYVYMFYYFKGTKITLPKSLRTTTGYFTYYCQNLTDLVMPEAWDNDDVTIGNYFLYHCDLLTSVRIPEGTVAFVKKGTSTLGEYFYYVMNLEELILPSTLKYVEGSYFLDGASGASSNTKLKRLVFPEGFEYIANAAFYYASALEEVVFLGEVKGIGQNVINGTTGTTAGYTNPNVKFYFPAYQSEDDLKALAAGTTTGKDGFYYTATANWMGTYFTGELIFGRLPEDMQQNND